MVDQQEKAAYMRQRRDAKAYDHLVQYAPVWIADEQLIYEEDAIQFEVVFVHPQYGWVKRRYVFDSFNNVLYQKGQIPIDEEETYDLQATDPYIDAEFINTVNSYGG